MSEKTFDIGFKMLLICIGLGVSGYGLTLMNVHFGAWMLFIAIACFPIISLILVLSPFGFKRFRK